MLYFIPAWYKEKTWQEDEAVWYRPKQVSEFDDTVKQIQLFSRNHVCAYAVLVLSLAPNFRHFMHRQGIYHAPYWSCFDAMQGIRTRKLAPFSFHDLAWPEDVRFVYSPFAVIAVRNEQKFAQIDFAVGGNPTQVDFFQNDIRVRRNLYDDRGFVSCSILFRNGAMWCEQYFDENGVWKFCRFLDDGHVEVNPKSASYWLQWGKCEKQVPYRQQTYSDISGMIREVLGEFLTYTRDDDIFTVAMHPLHNEILAGLLARRRCIASIFEQRRGLTGTEEEQQLLKEARYIVVSSQSDKKSLETMYHSQFPNVEVITPYDSRVEIGVSQQFRVQNVLLTVDRVPEDVFREQIQIMAGYMKENPHVRTHLFTRRVEYGRESGLLQNVRQILAQSGYDPQWAREDKQGVTENAVDDDTGIPILFTVDSCVDEMAVSICLRKQRLLVDLQPVPDPFLQISAMSIGLPQITSVKTPYIEDGKNGRILQNPGQLSQWLPFYLENIANWNDAMIASYDLGSRFTADRLVERWKKIIDYVEHSGITVGR